MNYLSPSARASGHVANSADMRQNGKFCVTGIIGMHFMHRLNAGVAADAR